MHVVSVFGLVRVDLSVAEATAITRLLKARREGGAMVSSDSMVLNLFENKVAAKCRGKNTLTNRMLICCSDMLEK